MTDRASWAVPRLWPGATIACLGGGPSLDARAVARLRGRVRVIAINDAWRLAPWADALYACDARWWRRAGGAPGFPGLKITLSNSRGQLDAHPEIRIVENTGTLGLERDPRGLRTGRSGGYQAINLAVHFGAARVLLLGYDLRAAPDGRTHWFGDHADWPTRPAIYRDVMLPPFAGLARELAELGVAVVNCTPASALDCFAKMDLGDALADGL